MNNSMVKHLIFYMKYINPAHTQFNKSEEKRIFLHLYLQFLSLVSIFIIDCEQI